MFLKKLMFNKIKNIENFYLFYHSLLITFNTGINILLKDILIKLNNPKVIISDHLTDSPDKPYKKINVEINDLKEYDLNDRQEDFVFRSCVIYLYSILEDMLIYRKFNTIVLGLLTNNIFIGYYSIAEKVIKIIQMLQKQNGILLGDNNIKKEIFLKKM